MTQAHPSQAEALQIRVMIRRLKRIKLTANDGSEWAMADYLLEAITEACEWQRYRDAVALTKLSLLLTSDRHDEVIAALDNVIACRTTQAMAAPRWN